MRIATYNVEWFDALFDDDGQPVADDARSRRHGVTRAQQLEALGIVFTAMDADAVLVVEAPDQGRKRNTTRALEAFAALFDLRARRAVIGFANETQQEISLLFDPDALSARHDPQQSRAAPRFDGTFRIDLDVDDTADAVVFSKPPLELAVETSGGFVFRMIGAHLKSKAPHGARTRDEVMQQSIANRRKQLAQAIWLRGRIETALTEGPLIVAGDMNDGPGLDAYESLFGQSSVEILLGQEGLFDPHAAKALGRRPNLAAPTTARFWIEKEGRYLQALLDYIMISNDLRARAPRWRIWHPLDDPRCWAVPELRDALVAASDHFPVTLDLDI
ncbi:MAG: endonuclease/exonuclease/phosphatase family protein [Pseudomonadota bacterium]